MSVYWQDGPTVFSASSDELTFEDLESFVDSLEPTTRRRLDAALRRSRCPMPLAPSLDVRATTELRTDPRPLIGVEGAGGGVARIRTRRRGSR